MLDDTTPEAPASNEVQQAGLSITDLRLFKEIVDVASARGAFKADEFSAIGETYTRLTNFLNHVDAQNAPNDEGEEETTDTNDEVSEETTDTNDEVSEETTEETTEE